MIRGTAWPSWSRTTRLRTQATRRRRTQADWEGRFKTPSDALRGADLRYLVSHSPSGDPCGCKYGVDLSDRKPQAGLGFRAGNLLVRGGSELARVHQGRRLLSEASVEAMTTNHLTPEQIAGGGVMLDGQGWGYCLGVSVPPDAMSAPGRYGWSGATARHGSTTQPRADCDSTDPGLRLPVQRRLDRVQPAVGTGLVVRGSRSTSRRQVRDAPRVPARSGPWPGEAESWTYQYASSTQPHRVAACR